VTANLVAEAARFVAEASFAALPARAVETARLGFTDALATLIAGRGEPVARAVAAYAAETGPGSVPALLGEMRLSPEFAALADATAAHALDYDDYAFANHPSAVMMPAILAAAHLAGADGRRMATAYAVGYEVWAEVMAREPDHLHSKGWHPTAVLGPLGASAAAAHALGLDASAVAHALGLAASHGGGVMANFGTMTKPYHAGRAAAAGVRAALLARAGVTSSAAALDGETGLLAALSPEGRADRTTPPAFGRRWRIAETGLNVKKYPTVGASQRVIDALLDLKAEDVPLDKLVEIAPRVSVKYAKLMPFAMPETPAEAKFSLAFACAAALRFGRVTLREVTEEALADPELRRLMALVRVDAVEEYDPDYPVPAPYDMVRLTFDNGRVLETEKVRRATGHADRPLAQSALREKFAACAVAGGLAPRDAEALFDRARTFDALDSAAGFVLPQWR